MRRARRCARPHTHGSDAGLTRGPARRRAWVATLHFPILQVVVDNAKRLYQLAPADDAKPTASSSTSLMRRTRGRPRAPHHGSGRGPADGGDRDAKRATDACPAKGHEEDGGLTAQATETDDAAVSSDRMLSYGETRDTLACFLHVAKGALGWPADALRIAGAD